MQPCALIGLDQGSRFRRELSAEGLISRRDGAIERGELWVATDSMLPWRLRELSVEALCGGGSAESKDKKHDVSQAHSGGNSIRLPS
jgi:hypothetical protein